MRRAGREQRRRLRLSRFEGCASSVSRVSLNPVLLTEADIARIPRTNLRVRRDEFVALWVAAERLCDEQARRGHTDWYAGGVVCACRWLATAAVRSPGGARRPARSPATERAARAYEELIEAEYLAAEKLHTRRPRPAWVAARPGWSDAICATLRWAWRGTGPPPLALEEPNAG